MKILSIAKKTILRSLRDINTMLIMCAMPLALIFVLGLAFESIMGNDGSIEISDMHITYSIIGERSELSNGIDTMMDEILSDHSTYEMSDNKENELEKLRAAHITAYIEINETDGEIVLYKNNRVNTTSSILESALRSFTARYNTIMEIASINPMAIQTVLANENQEHIENVGLNEKYRPSAMDYYGVVMTALFILYGFLTPLEEVIGDKKDGLTTRISTTPVNPAERFIGNVLGYVSVSTIRAAIVIIVAKVAFGVNWGAQPIYPFILLFALIIVMTSLGMLLGEIFKSNSAASTVGHLFIVITAFFGGAYMTLENMGTIGSIGKYLSLIWWTNTGIINQIYNNDYSNYFMALIIFAILSILFLSASVVMNNRREAYS